MVSIILLLNDYRHQWFLYLPGSLETPEVFKWVNHCLIILSSHGLFLCKKKISLLSLCLDFQQCIILAAAEMSLPKLTRLLAGAQRHQRLLLPSVTPLSVSRRAVIQGEYRRPGKAKEPKYPWQRINFDLNKGLEGIRKNFLLLKKEFFDRWVGPEGKPIIEHMLELNRVVWEFRGPESLEQWALSCDREIGGESEVHLKMGRNNSTCFLHGTLVSTPPKDGETRYSGYCTMRSKQQLVSLRSCQSLCCCTISLRQSQLSINLGL